MENYYGTPRAYVEKELALGHNVILEIEVEGALQIKEQYPEAILIFISASSAIELKDRLTGRGTESIEVVNKRMNRAREEAESIPNYEYFVINRDGALEECVDEIHAIVTARRKEIRLWNDDIIKMQNELMSM